MTCHLHIATRPAPQPATKGFEIGSGFKGAEMLGSEHNDPFRIVDGRVRTTANRSGGGQGGISNGEDIVIRVAFKPTSTIGKAQQTVTRDGEEVELRARGRHDPCVVPRAVPMGEGMQRVEGDACVAPMVALTLADQASCNHAIMTAPLPHLTSRHSPLPSQWRPWWPSPWRTT